MQCIDLCEIRMLNRVYGSVFPIGLKKKKKIKKIIKKKIRSNPHKNTLTILKDPKNDRTLYLIGTTNSSTLLSYRTRELI